MKSLAEVIASAIIDQYDSDRTISRKSMIRAIEQVIKDINDPPLMVRGRRFDLPDRAERN